MADLRYPIAMIGGVPVVEAPPEIDAANAECFRKSLLRAFCGHPTVVVNMTGTRFCDSAGVHVLARAHERAVAEGGELLLVLPASAAVLRVFALTAIDRLIPSFADLNEALEQAHAVVPRPPQRRAEPGIRTAQTSDPVTTPDQPSLTLLQTLAYRGVPNPSGSCRGRHHTDRQPPARQDTTW